MLVRALMWLFNLFLGFSLILFLCVAVDSFLEGEWARGLFGLFYVAIFGCMLWEPGARKPAPSALPRERNPKQEQAGREPR